MGIRSDIKKVLAQRESNQIDAFTALNQITSLVNQPKQQKLSLPVDVFTLTVTLQPDLDAWHSHIDYNLETLTPDAVRAALESICEFAEERHLVESAKLFTTN